MAIILSIKLLFSNSKHFDFLISPNKTNEFTAGTSEPRINFYNTRLEGVDDCVLFSERTIQFFLTFRLEINLITLLNSQQRIQKKSESYKNEFLKCNGQHIGLPYTFEN